MSFVIAARKALLTTVLSLVAKTLAFFTIVQALQNCVVVNCVSLMLVANSMDTHQTSHELFQ